MRAPDQPSLSVEIFRDQMTPCVQIGQARRAIDIVRDAAPDTEFHILADDRTFPVGQPAGNYIDLTDFNLNRPLRADISLILTERILVDRRFHETMPPRDKLLYGKAFNLSHSLSRVAIVDAERAPVITAPHEIGHLFDVKNFGHMYDGKRHCIDSDCIMHETTIGQQATRFCVECSAQLNENALQAAEQRLSPA